VQLQRIGHIQLRDSLSRFYLPHYSGTNHDKRQQTLVTEGLIKSKSSSILGVGSSDLGSYGVEDQFSKAQVSEQAKRASLDEDEHASQRAKRAAISKRKRVRNKLAYRREYESLLTPSHLRAVRAEPAVLGGGLGGEHRSRKVHAG